jgi:MFS family permease
MQPEIARASQAGATYPGFRGTVAALSIGQILCWASMFYGFSSFVLPMQRELHWDEPTLMAALTLGFTVWGAAAYAVGAAIDRGHGRAVMTGGVLLGALGFFGWSLVSQPWMLAAVWVLLGAAMAMTLYDPAFMVLTKRYPLRYREGITALTLVGGFASTLSFPAVNVLLAAVGWRDALRLIGLVVLLVALPLHAWALRGPPIVVGPRVDGMAADTTMREAFRASAFWLLALCFTLYAFASAALWAHVMPIFVSKGFDALQATAVLVWFGPAQVFGRVAYAWLGRGLPLRRMGVVVLLGIPLALALLALATTQGLLVVFALIFGMANGLITIVRAAIVPEYFGRAHVGRISGAMTALSLLARAAAPLLAAWMLLWMGGYPPVLMVLVGLGLIAVVAFVLARPPPR